jgi:hypothetical protein
MADFIGESLTVLQQECNPAYVALCQTLSPRQLELVIDGETVLVAFFPDQILLPARLEKPVLWVQTSRQTILDLIYARQTLSQAVTHDTLSLRGAVNDVVAFYEGFLLYVKGAVRCPTFPLLLEKFETDTIS